MDKKRLLLTSDLHLGFRTRGNLSSGDERITTLKKICSLAIKHDILLVAGDLIHDETAGRDYLEAIDREFRFLLENNVEVFYTPGAGELAYSGNINPAVMGLATTHTFCDEDGVFSVTSGKGNIYIYGIRRGSSADFSMAAKNGKAGFHLGLFNTGFNPAAENCADNICIGKDNIKQMNLNFYAMGGDHNFRVFRLANRIIGAFAGSPEPCTPFETGDRYAVSIELVDGSVSNIKRIAVNTARVLNVEIECSGLLSESELVDRIKSSLQKENSYVLKLTGERDFIIGDILKKEISGYFRCVDMTDHTLPHLNIIIEENSSGDDLQSHFFKKLSLGLDRGDVHSPQTIAGILHGNFGGRRLFCDF